MRDFKKAILFIGGGKESLPGIKLAKEKKIKIIVADKSKNAPAKKFANYFINASTYDPKKILKILIKKKIKIDGVMSLSADVPFTVNLIAKKFNLHGYKLNSAKILSNKYKMKLFFKKNKINTPNFICVKNLKEFKKKILKFKQFVIKPVDSRGARGVFLLNNNSKNLLNYYFKSKKFSKEKKVLIEEYLSGQQLSTETIITNYTAYTVGISDRNYDKIETLAPHIIENGSDLPSIYQKKFYIKINNVIQKIAKKLKIRNGTIKGDLIVSKKKIIVIEVAGRLSGGYFSSHMIPGYNGIDLVNIAIEISLNKKIEKSHLKKKYLNYVSQRFIFSDKIGVIKKIKIPRWIKKSKNILFFDLNIKKGSRIKKISNHTDRIGQVIVKSKSKKYSTYLANKICESVKIQIN